DNESYWTPTGWQWRHGQLEESGPIEELLELRQHLLKNPKEIEKSFKEGRITPDYADTLRTVIRLSEDELRQQLAQTYAPQPHRQPHFWDDPAYNASNQPVVGVTWFEAMAYCAWLHEQLAVNGKQVAANSQRLVLDRPEINVAELLTGGGRQVRLPTEAEWEWAAGGPDHRRYPWGKTFDAEKANTLEGRVLTTSPVGAYPGGAARCGALDMSGNVWEWTHTIYKAYPYRADDGREETERTDVRRALRGGGWFTDGRFARVSYRYHSQPDYFFSFFSFRLVVAPVIL
ncbi:MAG: formylglycine-generating enzyme family protein, partial [Gammaproteobacteria bacterium]|nr:formylglycine-generating enzyme family protein [Gammaproteobacteria bacterium]